MSCHLQSATIFKLPKIINDRTKERQMFDDFSCVLCAQFNLPRDHPTNIPHAIELFSFVFLENDGFCWLSKGDTHTERKREMERHSFHQISFLIAWLFVVCFFNFNMCHLSFCVALKNVEVACFFMTLLRFNGTFNVAINVRLCRSKSHLMNFNKWFSIFVSAHH